MNKKMIAAGLGLAGIIVIVTVIPGWARLNENKEIKPTPTPELERTLEIKETELTATPSAQSRPTFVFDDLEVNLEDENQLERISISDPAAGCSLTVADEIPYPDEPALTHLIEQLVESINDRDADLVNTLLAREEDQVEFIPAMPKIQEYAIHYQADGIVKLDLTWLDCDQLLYSQYWITLAESDGLKIDTLREKPECKNRASVMLGEESELIDAFVTALTETNYFDLLALYPRNAPCSETGFDLWESVKIESAEVLEMAMAGNESAALIEVDTEDPGCTQLAAGKQRYCLVMEKTENYVAIEGFYRILEE